ncbi:ATP-binding protein [Sphaerisporangium sp. NPDC051017]|uniref:ATP-binding protein n=1 Tax=Sphaerisporangium sp. NPDC051017 TaxID=3154636 RepID=UPI003411FF70
MSAQQTLVSELIGSSIRHTASGRGGSVTIAVLEVGGTLRVEVADSGGGDRPLPLLQRRTTRIGTCDEAGRGHGVAMGVHA